MSQNRDMGARDMRQRGRFSLPHFCFLIQPLLQGCGFCCRFNQQTGCPSQLGTSSINNFSQYYI